MEREKMEFDPNPEKPSFEFGAKTVKSEKHPERNNQDALLFNEEEMIFAIFDGMGGHPAGDVASEMASKFINKEAEKLSNLSIEEIKDELKEILIKTDRKIFLEGLKDKKKFRMATTVSVVKIWENQNGEKKAIIGNMGDSRVYILRVIGELEQITLDDKGIFYSSDEIKNRKLQKILSSINTKEDFSKFSLELEITPKKLEDYFFDHTINNAIGFNRDTKPQMFIIDIEAGDRILITSDGLRNLTDKEIQDILIQEKDSKKSVESLMEFSQKRSKEENHVRSKKDDMSAIVLGFN